MNKITPQLIISTDMKAASTEQITSTVNIISKISSMPSLYEVSSVLNNYNLLTIHVIRKTAASGGHRVKDRGKTLTWID
jgi:hypothetical protein